jgi:hypothetical protein
MMLSPDRYEPDPENSEERPNLAADDIHSLEVRTDHQCALRIIREIMYVHDLTEDMIIEELALGGVDWAKAGDTEIDLSFLSVA